MYIYIYIGEGPRNREPADEHPGLLPARRRVGVMMISIHRSNAVNNMNVIISSIVITLVMFIHIIDIVNNDIIVNTNDNHKNRYDAARLEAPAWHHALGSHAWGKPVLDGDIRVFIWGFDYNFTNYDSKKTLNLKKKHEFSTLWQDICV